MENSVMLNAVCNEPVSLKVLEEPFYRKGFSPFVNKETGTWWEYDDDKKGFFDTGIIAQGRDGNDYVITEQDYNTIVERTLSNVNPTLDEKLSTKLPKSPANWEPWTAEEQVVARDRISGFAYRHIATLEITENVHTVIISNDSNGNPFSLRDVIIKTYSPVNSLRDGANGYYQYNGIDEHFGAVSIKQNKTNTTDEGYGYSRAILLPNNRIVLELNNVISSGKIASSQYLALSNGTKHDILYRDIHSIKYAANGQLEIGTIFEVWGIDI